MNPETIYAAANTYLSVAVSYLQFYVVAFGAALPGLASPELAAVIAGVAVGAMLAGIHRVFRPPTVRRRLRRYVTQQRQAEAVAAPTPSAGSPSLMEGLERRLARRAASANIRTQLVRAGVSLTLSEFVGLRVASGLLVATIAGYFAAPSIGLSALIVALAAGMAGSLLPNLVLSTLIRRRMETLYQQIPTGIDIVASSLQVGSGLAQGFALLSREMSGPLAEEFSQVLQEVNLGLSMGEALTNMANRVNNDELDLLVTTIIIQTRVGGNLVQVLRTTGETIRERINLKGEISALTAQQRFSAFVIAILPPFVAGILWLMSPQYMSGLLAPGIAQFMLFGAVAMQLDGGAWREAQDGQACPTFGGECA